MRGRDHYQSRAVGFTWLALIHMAVFSIGYSFACFEGATGSILGGT